MVSATLSKYDLDNIKLSTTKLGKVDTIFVLTSILVQGHVSEQDTSDPPRGVEFVLGNRNNQEVTDTITMINLGYIQLKALPGVWDLRLRKGRSRDIYRISSVGTTRDIIDEYKIVIDSFEGVTILPNLVKRPGMENEQVLDPQKDSSGSSMFQNIKQAIFGEEKKLETINIFSVASGHLYERFLSIMMLSVMKRTKNPVKFWLIEDFLSPVFKDFVPHLAKQYGFQVEFVTYKWPHWLREQTEKQRIIWGYKILFLDVLFPLGIDKVFSIHLGYFR